MTTENRAIRIRGMVDDILAGGVEIPVHRTTSCGLAAVAQETGQTNIHFEAVYTGSDCCAILPYGTRRREDQKGSRKVRLFLKDANDADHGRLFGLFSETDGHKIAV
jgi:hypothetical protein